MARAVVEWFSMQDVAEYLGISLRQVPRLKIKYSMLGPRLRRYAKADIDAYLERHAERPDENGRPRKAAHRFRTKQLDDVEARLAKLGRRPTRRP